MRSENRRRPANPVERMVRPSMNHQLTSAAIGHQPVMDTALATKAGRSDRAAAPGTMLRLRTTVQGAGAASRRVDNSEGPTKDTLTLNGTEISHVRLLRCEKPNAGVEGPPTSTARREPTSQRSAVGGRSPRTPGWATDQPPIWPCRAWPQRRTDASCGHRRDFPRTTRFSTEGTTSRSRRRAG